jgi:hypothetical protein
MPDMKARARRILQYFNLTLQEWQAISEHQLNRCAICGRPPKPNKNLATDHCHKTGLVRGLLCTMCNRLLGKVESQWRSVVTILIAIQYLKNPPAVMALGREVFTYPGRLGTKKHLKELKKLKKSK